MTRCSLGSLLLLPALASACAGSFSASDLADAGGSSSPSADTPAAQPPPSPYTGAPVVYAHSASELYRVDATSLAVTLVGAFAWPSGPDQMTDIALDRNGKMTGISFNTVYSVDPKTAACTFLAPLQGPAGVSAYNGLSYIAVQAADAKEVLVASAADGSLYEIDPVTGHSKPVGVFGGGLGSSGDLVSVKGLTLTTVERGDGQNDWLARVDPLTGQATLIGDTGFEAVWGLGFWGDKVYGFTQGRQLILIDPSTGKGTQTATSAASFWGAGVTTSAPVIE